MTGDRCAGGPLGRRLLAAFLLVALSSVVVLTLAAAGRHRPRSGRTRRRRPATDRRPGGRGGGDRLHRRRRAGPDARLAAASALAEAAGARLVVLDAGGPAPCGPVAAMGPGHARHERPGAHGIARRSSSAGTVVGTVRLVFPAAAGASARGRRVGMDRRRRGRRARGGGRRELVRRRQIVRPLGRLARPRRGRSPAATGPPAPRCTRPASSGSWPGVRHHGRRGVPGRDRCAAA